jgi:peptidoglycan hydrolase-like protein with peptidoglycan-binding domain
MSKNKLSLEKIVIVISAIVATLTGSVFLILYSRNFISTQVDSVGTSNANSVVLTSKNFGSYGELMFAYIGKNNYIYNLDDESKPLIEQPATLLLYASDDTVIYTASTEIDSTHYGRESVIQELQIGEVENTLNTVATVSIDPCWSSNDEVVYFVKDDNLKQLCTFEPLTSTTEVATEFEEDISSLRISSDGLLVVTASGEEKLYVPLSKQLTDTYYNCQGSHILVCEQYDLILTPDGILYYRWMGANEAVKVAENVLVTQGYQDNQIFFIQQTQDGLVLMDYFVSEEQSVELAKLPNNVLPQLTVSADYAFIVDDYNIVYRYDIDNRNFEPFCTIQDDVQNPLISVFDYRLMVYDLAREADQTFVYSIDATHTLLESEIFDLNSLYSEKLAEENPDDLEYKTLQMGSIGADVLSLQNNLVTLGYLTSDITGIFDIDTMIAVQYLQLDLGLETTGLADSTLQSTINSGAVAEYSGYNPISNSSTGIRVRDVQARLRTLDYSKEAITGTFTNETEKALILFANQNGLQYDGGVVTSQVLDSLFDSIATSYHGYLPLSQGDSCDAVIKLNYRLKELGYLTGSINPTVDSKTINAMSLFEQVNDLTVTDEYSSETIAKVFDDSAIICPENLAPETISDSISSNENQVISDRQLKIIRKWLTKQFAVNHTDKQAIKRLQMQLVKLGYMQVQDVSMVYDLATMNAVSNFQLANDIPVDGIASKSTLTNIFSTAIGNAEE